jgi:hypothetical protein
MWGWKQRGESDCKTREVRSSVFRFGQNYFLCFAYMKNAQMKISGFILIIKYYELHPMVRRQSLGIYSRKIYLSEIFRNKCTQVNFSISRSRSRGKVRPPIAAINNARFLSSLQWKVVSLLNAKGYLIFRIRAALKCISSKPWQKVTSPETQYGGKKNVLYFSIHNDNRGPNKDYSHLPSRTWNRLYKRLNTLWSPTLRSFRTLKVLFSRQR